MIHSPNNFNIAYTGEPAPDLFEDWARAVWAILDGHKLTYIRVEEYSDGCANPGPINRNQFPFHRRLWTQSRKYGGIIHATSQRPQMISKDALGNAGLIWASSMDLAGADSVGREIDIKAAQLRELAPGQFYRWQIGGEAEKIHVFTPKN